MTLFGKLLAVLNLIVGLGIVTVLRLSVPDIGGTAPALPTNGHNQVVNRVEKEF